MADLENKKANNPETKNVKKKSDKPSLWSRIKSFARSIKSEVKKISWSPWTDVRKNTLVVVVVIAVFLHFFCFGVIRFFDFQICHNNLLYNYLDSL